MGYETLDNFLGIKDNNQKIGDEIEFPKIISKVRVPPIKCQGIKTKLINFITSNIKWKGTGIWLEPFMGSGVVTFNATPKKAVLADVNPHIINFYKAIQKNEITPSSMRKFLNFHGEKLSKTGKSTDSYYYTIREKFNENYDPKFFLFLNRSCFNGLIRFNSKGKFNTPFGRKPTRFSKSYITKIVNQIDWVQKVIKLNDYVFKCSDWKPIVENLTDKDFVYVDPPYYGRHDTYFNKWSEKKALELVDWSKSTRSGFAISLWLQNRHRKNTFISENWNNCMIRTNTHYYFLGSTEDKRSKMEEALIIKPGYATETIPENEESFKNYYEKKS